MPPDNVISVLIARAFQKQHLDVPQERVASLSMHLRCHLAANARFVTIMPNSMLRFNADYERRHGLAEAIGEYDRLMNVYPSLGYEIHVLPKMSVTERADWILTSLTR